MKSGQTPIHIQRWAPADYHADEHVKLLKARRDYRTLTFYRHFIDASFISGGDLPSDVEALAAVVDMPLKDVRHALNFCLGRMIEVRGDRLVQGRVERDIAQELEFRAAQSERGKLGGRPKAKSDGLASGGLAVALPVVVSRQSPPAPAPAPAPYASKQTPRLEAVGRPLAQEFFELWSSCQKKSGKATAERAYLKLGKAGKLPPASEILAKFEALQASEDWTKEGRRFQPHLATWLNRGGWEDEVRQPSGPPLPSYMEIPEEDRAMLRKRSLGDFNHAE